MIAEIPPDSFVRDKTLGYFYAIANGHPCANKNGKVYMHRYVASVRAGRPLDRCEHVHHINGDKGDNRAENLKVVSATEHARIHALESGVIVVSCAKCGADVFVGRKRKSRSKSGQLFCSASCQARHAMKFVITKADLEKMVWSMPATAAAKILGVSDVAIAKRCKSLNVKKPSPGYWAKPQAERIEIRKMEAPCSF